MQNYYNKISIKEINRICNNKSQGATTKIEQIARIVNDGGYGKSNTHVRRRWANAEDRLRDADKKITLLKAMLEEERDISQSIMEVAEQDMKDFEEEGKRAFLRRLEMERNLDML
jgi:hypothetical protein